MTEKNKDNNSCDREECQNMPICFKCKIASISFGTVPGGYKSSSTK